VGKEGPEVQHHRDGEVSHKLPSEKKNFNGEEINSSQRHSLIRFLMWTEETPEGKISILVDIFDALDKDYRMTYPDDGLLPFAEDCRTEWIRLRAKLIGVRM